MTPYKIAIATLAASALAASAHAAGANTSFEAFKSVCVSSTADLAAVKAAADSHGWGATDAKGDANMNGVTITDQLDRAMTADKVGLVLSAWQGVKGAVKINDCTVHIAKADYDSVRAAAGAWTAFPAQVSSAKRETYRFTTGKDGKPTALTPAEFDAAAAAAGLEILSVSGDQDGTVLDLMTIRK